MEFCGSDIELLSNSSETEQIRLCREEEEIAIAKQKNDRDNYNSLFASLAGTGGMISIGGGISLVFTSLDLIKRAGIASTYRPCLGSGWFGIMQRGSSTRDLLLSRADLAKFGASLLFLVAIILITIAIYNIKVAVKSKQIQNLET
ncbi:MAG: hypothetical protein LBJ93_02755 [Clostridiales bacterium]|jgi:hypothetical protein|nr:hypothetical protein [Clostridiales bacterium]